MMSSCASPDVLLCCCRACLARLPLLLNVRLQWGQGCRSSCQGPAHCCLPRTMCAMRLLNVVHVAWQTGQVNFCAGGEAEWYGHSPRKMGMPSALPVQSLHIALATPARWS